MLSWIMVAAVFLTREHGSLDFEKANEIYFRLGIIYKSQRKHELSLDVRP